MFMQHFFAGNAVFHQADAQERSLHALQELFKQRIHGFYLAVALKIVNGFQGNPTEFDFCSENRTRAGVSGGYCTFSR